MNIRMTQDEFWRTRLKRPGEPFSALDEIENLIPLGVQERSQPYRNGVIESVVLDPLQERPYGLAPPGRIRLPPDAPDYRWRQFNRVDAFDRSAKIAPVLSRQIDLVPVATLDKGVKNRLEAIQACPQLPGLGRLGGDDLPDALVAEKLGQRHGGFVKGALS